MKAIYRQLTPQVHAEPENDELAKTEATATQVFLAGRKRVRNASVPRSLERSPTCQRATKAMHRKMAPDVRAESKDEDLAAVEATTPQGFPDYTPPTRPARVADDANAGCLRTVQSGPTIVTSLDTMAAEPTRPVRVTHDAKAGCFRTIQSGPTTATSMDTVAGGLSDIQLALTESRLLRRDLEQHMRELELKMEASSAHHEELVLKLDADIARFRSG
ncbi:unnamed protein product [Urochloa humidicola]